MDPPSKKLQTQHTQIGLYLLKPCNVVQLFSPKMEGLHCLKHDLSQPQSQWTFVANDLTLIVKWTLCQCWCELLIDFLSIVFFIELESGLCWSCLSVYLNIWYGYFGLNSHAIATLIGPGSTVSTLLPAQPPVTIVCVALFACYCNLGSDTTIAILRLQYEFRRVTGTVSGAKTLPGLGLIFSQCGRGWRLALSERQHGAG